MIVWTIVFVYAIFEFLYDVMQMKYDYLIIQRTNDLGLVFKYKILGVQLNAQVNM